jgi:alkylation response protein AidB-like acyl-CoA dehydrogenase
VATDKRIPFESPYPTLAEDPVLQYQIGLLSARILSVAALLENTAHLLDEVQQAYASQQTQLYPQLRAQLSAAKALAAEVSRPPAAMFFLERCPCR